ncbi:MAG: hypothetical protein MH252_21775 [Thermosynechococcaceae cyanobacterium MS004]|nr:hypothetical protein [Thermosynechococcaceae cyanobacterium MS004]
MPKDNDPQAQSNASIVIEYDEIAQDKEAQFLHWQSEIKAGLLQFEGYLKTDVCRPIPGVQEKWYIVVHFDSSAHLGEWLDSDIRYGIIGKGKKKFGPYRYKIQTGFEGWFGQFREGASEIAPPAWKQACAVLLGLYPTVMLETMVFDQFGIMASWPLAPKMFVNNLVSCVLLTWVVMPLTTGVLKFWLKPQAGRDGRDERSPFLSQTNLMGLLIILIAYGFMIVIFQSVTR